jgi:hypothetical protein
VFNTGQIVHGLVRAARESGGTYLESAAAGGRWLAAVQDDDGAWRQHAYQRQPHSYYTHVAWPLVELWQATGEVAFKAAAERHFAWVLAQQRPNGWLDHASFVAGAAPYTHTIAYAAQGLLEGGVLLGRDDLVEGSRRLARPLRQEVDTRGHLRGQYDEQWCGVGRYSCLTGNVQAARVFLRLGELDRDPGWAEPARRLIDWTLGWVDPGHPDPGVRGALPGSGPVWGDYIRWRFPNWAAKFALDALQALAATRSGVA